MATRSPHFESRVSPACNKHSNHVLEQKHVTIQQRLVEVPEVVIYRRRILHSLVSYTRKLSCNNKNNNNNNDNQLDVMTLASEQLQFVQHQLNYHFRDISRLVLCFRAAHRSDLDGTADDGNRKFAKTRGRVEGSIQKTARADTHKIPLARG
jgi:hypothetical protein